MHWKNMFSITGNSAHLEMADCLVLCVEKGSEAEFRLEGKNITAEKQLYSILPLVRT